MLTDLRINNVSLHGVDGRILEVLDGAMTVPSLRGDNFVSSGRSGSQWNPKVYESAIANVVVTILATDSSGNIPATVNGRLEQLRTNYRALLALVNTSRAPFEVTRGIISSGSTVWQKQNGEIDGNISPEFLGDTAMRVVFGIRLLDGVWTSVTTTTANPVGTLTVGGDTRTTALSVTINGTGARTLTNTTTGHTVTIATGVGAVVIDCEAFTVKKVADGTNAWSFVTFSGGSGPYLFALEAGANVITLSSSTASITYREAFL
jgi:hypothetical protein